MKKFNEVSIMKTLFDGLKIFAFLGFVMIAMTLVGCTSTGDIENTKDEPEKKVESPAYDKKDLVKKEETKEKVDSPVYDKKDVVKKEETNKVTPDDVQAAYEYLRPAVEEMSKGLDHDYQVIDGAIYLTGYISQDELYAAINADRWKDNVKDLQASTKIISGNLRDAGYDTYKIKFNFAYCDKINRQQTTYLLVRDGRVVYDTAKENDLYKEQ